MGTMKTKTDRLFYIGVFIEFCQSDLTNPSPKEKIDCIIMLQEFLFRPYFAFPNALEPTDEEWLEVLSVQQELLDFLNWMTDNLEEKWELHFMAPSTLEWAGGKGPDSVFRRRPSTVRRLLERKLRIRFFSETGKPGSESNSVPWGVMNFFEALEGLSTSSLARCPHCEKIFFNPTKRKKIYCSPLCQNTAGVQRLRKKRKN